MAKRCDHTRTVPMQRMACRRSLLERFKRRRVEVKKWRARRIYRESKHILSKSAKRTIKFFRGQIRSRSFYWYILPSIQNALKVHKAMKHRWK